MPIFQEIPFFLKLLTGDTVPTLLSTLINIAIVPNPLEKILDDLLMIWCCCATESVVLNISLAPERIKPCDDAIAMNLGIDTRRNCCALDFLPMFISPSN
jgi:hypothetical protein